jgi:hypothetical protein
MRPKPPPTPPNSSSEGRSSEPCSQCNFDALHTLLEAGCYLCTSCKSNPNDCLIFLPSPSSVNLTCWIVAFTVVKQSHNSKNSDSLLSSHTFMPITGTKNFLRIWNVTVSPVKIQSDQRQCSGNLIIQSFINFYLLIRSIRKLLQSQKKIIKTQ